MPDVRNPTLREIFLENATKAYHDSRTGLKLLTLELVRDHTPPEHVLRYGAAELSPGIVRVGIVYDYPGHNGSGYVGADIPRTDVPRWFSVRLVPVVRVRNYKAK